MSVTRAALAVYLAGDLAEWLADAGLGTTDTTGALKEPIDAALRALGVPEDDLGGGAFAIDAFPAYEVARYYGLRRVRAAIGKRVDVSVDGDGSKSRSQAIRALDAELAQAKADAAPYLTNGADAIQVGRFSLDIYAPEPV